MDFEVTQRIERREFQDIPHWLRDKIFLHGGGFKPSELVVNTTGRS